MSTRRKHYEQFAKTDSQSGYSGVGKSYDSYGNETKKGDAIEYGKIGRKGRLYAHKMKGKYGPKKVTGRGGFSD
jgi:hypothetical protein